MIQQALILAAGRGRPVAAPDVPNCLAAVGGQPLLWRTLRTLAGADVRRIAITVGWQAEQVMQAANAWQASEPGARVAITFFKNPAWDRPNGLSVLAARSFVVAPTLLMMADQIVAPHLVVHMLRAPVASDQTMLAVDRDLSRVFDFDDATKVALVRTDDPDHLAPVAAIGKGLTTYEAVSAGLFVMSPTLLAALEAQPGSSLTQGVAEAGRRGQVVARDVGGALWQDVDSQQMRLHAEWLLRVYGDDLRRPNMQAGGDTGPADTMALIERLTAEKNAPRYTLLNPGPVMTSARVKAALVHHDVCHRDLDYSGVVRRLQAKLRPVFGASNEHEMLLLTGSGTAAMEMAIASVVPPGKKILTIASGAFGERLGEIAALHGLPRALLAVPWGSLPDPAQVAAMLDADPDIAVVAMIHHETSVGLVNPVGAIGRLCRARNVLLVVDAVSSLGVEDLDVVRDGVDIAYSSANKCLHSVSGVSFLCVAPTVWPRIASIPPRVYYLDLQRYRKYLEDLDQTPFTPAVSAFFALETALDELAESGGVPARREVYRRRNLLIRRVLTDLGFVSLTNTGRESHTIVTMRVPPGVSVDALYDGCKQHGFVIYRCKGALGRDHVQVANMGELPDATIDAFLAAVAQLVQQRPSPV